MLHLPRTPLTRTVAVLCGLAVLVAAFVAVNRDSAPEPKDERRVVLYGDDPVKPKPAELTADCTTRMAPLRKLISANKYDESMSLAEAKVFVAATKEYGLCTADDVTALAEEIEAWAGTTPDTYDRDEKVPVSSRCRNLVDSARGVLRDAEASKDGWTTERANALNTVVAAARDTAACTPAELLLFDLTEVAPTKRRLGALPASKAGPQSTPVLELPKTVQVPDDTITMSDACAAQLNPIRDRLLSLDGEKVTDTLRGEITGQVQMTLTSGACTTAETDEFQSKIAGPAVGMATPAGDSPTLLLPEPGTPQPMDAPTTTAG